MTLNEVFKHLWMVVIIDHQSKEKTVIINDTLKLQKFYDEHHTDIWVGYNSRMYDQFILKGLLLGYDPYFINNEIITHGKNGWQVVRDNGEVTLYNFDIATGFHSLKQLEGFMGSMIKETDIPFDIDRELTPEEIDQVEFYCTHDVEETLKVFDHRREEFDSQLLMIEAFDLPMTMFNKTKAQLSAYILGAKRKDKRNDEFDIIFPDTLKISEKYKHIYDWYKDKNNRDYKKSYITDVSGVPHIFAWGGIHAAIPNYSAEGIIVHCDVASLYPSIMIEYDFMSRNVDDRNKYREIRDKRLKLKAEKNPMQAPLKIVLNSTYGAMKDKHNPLYDPRQANNVCVAGQLLLLDLIEKLEGHCELIQSNTDGLFLKVETVEQIETLKSIAKEWEIRTRLDLEWDLCKKIVQKDVNNYIIVNNDESYESKGAYIKKLSEVDYDLPIVNKALIDYFINKTPLRETIEQCNTLREFQKIVKITSLYKYALHGDKQIKEKVLRVFASKDETACGIFKFKAQDKIEKISNTPEKCFIYNEQVSDVECPEELDKEYYVQIAEKRLADFLDAKTTSKTAKFKSDIKFIGYDEKEIIMNIDQTNYDFFSDLIMYLIDAKIINQKQIGILISLGYFEKFGNAKELLRVLDIVSFFKFGKMKLLKKEKIRDNDSLYEIVKDWASDLNSKGEKTETFKLLNTTAIFRECESLIYSLNISDFSFKEKVALQIQYTGDVVPSLNENERPLLHIKEVCPLNRKKDKKQFGYGVIGKSLGSGIETRYTVFNAVYNKDPIEPEDIIRCKRYTQEGKYYTMQAYEKIG